MKSKEPMRNLQRSLALIGIVLVLALAAACAPSFGKPKKRPPGEKQTIFQLMGAPSKASPTVVGPPGTTPVALPEGCGPEESQAMRPDFGPDIFLMADAPCYNIDVTIGGGFDTFSGKETVYFTNTEDEPLRSVYFRLYPQASQVYGGYMKVKKAVVNKIEVLPEVAIEEDGSGVRIPLTEPLAPGKRLIIELEFEVTIPQDFVGVSTDSAVEGLFNHADRILTLVDWYPLLAFRDKQGWRLSPVSATGDSVSSVAALYYVRLATDLNVQAVSTGKQIGKTLTPWGNLYYTMVSGPARDFAMVLSKNLKVSEKQVDGVAVRSYYLPDDAGRANKALDVAAAALGTYQELFGPYPYTKFDLVGVPLRHAHRTTLPTLSLVSRSLYQAGGDERSFELSIARETAHQWWYGLVGSDAETFPWLNEALANYSAALYVERAEGAEAFHDTVDTWSRRWQDWLNGHDDEPLAQPLSSFQGRGEAYDTVVGVKGPLFLQAVREKIGDEAFFGALRQLFQQNRYGIIRPADLLSAFETTSGQDLQDLYHRWGAE